MAYRILLRRDTSANWTENNPVLSSGEPGFEIDTNLLKIGDGSNPWNDLSPINSPGITGPTGEVSWGEVPQTVTPAFTAQYDLGSSSLRWNNIWMAGSLYVNDSSVSISNSNGNFVITGSTGNSINGSLSISGDLTVAGTSSIIPYKTYVALVTQTVGAPTDVELANTFSGALTWDRTYAGGYTLTSADSEFSEDKVFVAFSQNSQIGTAVQPCTHKWNRVDSSTLSFETCDFSGATADGLLYSTSIEIRVYN